MDESEGNGNSNLIYEGAINSGFNSKHAASAHHGMDLSSIEPMEMMNEIIKELKPKTQVIRGMKKSLE